MKNVVLGLLVTLLFVSGCDSARVNSQDVDSSTTETSSKSLAPLSVNQPSHSVDDNTFTISGTADPEAKVIYTVDNGKKHKVELAEDGSFEVSGDLPASNETYRFTDGFNNSPVIVKSKENVTKSREETEQEKAEQERRQAEEEKKKSEEAAAKAQAEQERKDQLAKEQAAKEVAENSSSTSEITETHNSSSSESKNQQEVKKVSDDQESLLIAWTQEEGSDRGYDISYGGSSNWNVSINYIDGENRWITSTQDKKLGRVKTIYEWTGKENDGATLLYLLIDGTELVNKLP